MAYHFLFANNATTTLAQSVAATATVITVASGEGDLFPSPSTGEAFAVTLVDAATGLTNEICYCTSRSGDELTVVRGQEGKDAIAWSAGDTCANYITADVIESWLQESDLDGYITESTADERYLRNSGDAQTSSSPTTFNNGLLVTGGISDWSSDNVPNAVSVSAQFLSKNGDDQESSSPTTFSNGLYVSVATDWTSSQVPSMSMVAGYVLRQDGDAQSSTSPTTFSNGLYVNTTSDWTSTQVPSMSMVAGYSMRLAGTAQSCSSPTTFTNGLTSTYNVTDWTSNMVPNAVTIGANFLSKTGNQQTSSSPTTFNNGLWSTDVFYVSLIEAVGSSSTASVTLGSALRCGSQTVYVNAMSVDGTATRTIAGATDVSEQWNFSTTPEVNGTDVALVSEFANGSTGSSGYYIRVGNTLIQQFEASNITSTAQWITFPVEFSGTPAPPTGNVYGENDQDTQVYGATSSGCYVKCPVGSSNQGQPVSITVMGPVS